MIEITDKPYNKKSRKRYIEKNRKKHNGKIGSKKLYKGYCYNVRLRKKGNKK